MAAHMMGEKGMEQMMAERRGMPMKKMPMKYGKAPKRGKKRK